MAGIWHGRTGKRDAEAVSGLTDLRGGIDGTTAAGRCAGGSGNPVAGSDTGNGSICCGQEKYSDLADRTGDPFCTADSFRGGFRQTTDCGFKLLLYLSAHGSDPAAMFFRDSGNRKRDGGKYRVVCKADGTYVSSCGGSGLGAGYSGSRVSADATSDLWYGKILLGVVLPLIYCYGLLTMINGIWVEEKLTLLTELLEKAVGWILKASLGVVTGISVFQSLITPVLDSVKTSAVEKALSALPGIGNAADGLLELAVGSAVVIRNSIGVLLLLLLLAACAAPLLEILFTAFLIKCAAAFMGIVSDKRVTNCTDHMGNAGMLLFRTAGTAMLLFLITLALLAIGSRGGKRMQWLYRVIGQAGIFLICAQTVVHFRPKESYDKYLKLLLSVMLLLQLLQPVLTMFGGGDGWNAEEQVTGFMQELQTVLTRATEQAEQSQEEIGNTAAAVAQEAGEGYDPANVGSKILHRELLQEKTVGKYRIRRKRIGKMQKRRGIHVDIAPIRLE